MAIYLIFQAHNLFSFTDSMKQIDTIEALPTLSKISFAQRKFLKETVAPTLIVMITLWAVALGSEIASIYTAAELGLIMIAIGLYFTHCFWLCVLVTHYECLKSGREDKSVQ